MATLTSTGNVNLTSSTNWSPAQTPVAGDDLIIGAHTLTLDADMVLNTIRFNSASSRVTISGTSRSIEATNGFQVNASIAVLGTAAIPAGTSLTFTGQWIALANINMSAMFTSTGGDLTLRTVGSSQSAVLIDGTALTNGVWVISTSWTGGTLTTIGRYNVPTSAAGSPIATMSGGTWSHQSSGVNGVPAGNSRICNLSGTATINWTGSVDSISTVVNSGVFSLASSSLAHTIGQTGDTFLQRGEAVTSNQFTSMVVASGGAVECVGRFASRNGALCFYTTSGVINWRNQTHTIPATDVVGMYAYGGTINLTGLVLTLSTKFLAFRFGGGVITVSSGTSITCTSVTAFAVGYGFTDLDNKIVVLPSPAPTLPSVSDVAAGVSYGYVATPLTGTALLVDPTVLAEAITTAFNNNSNSSNEAF